MPRNSTWKNLRELKQLANAAAAANNAAVYSTPSPATQILAAPVAQPDAPAPQTPEMAPGNQFAGTPIRPYAPFETSGMGADGARDPFAGFAGGGYRSVMVIGGTGGLQGLPPGQQARVQAALAAAEQALGRRPGGDIQFAGGTIFGLDQSGAAGLPTSGIPFSRGDAGTQPQSP
ncbi:MAG TPA: hypothetical protein VGP46_12730 [Acidimicrobiales bacterium]|nr:hypothetical protein [Acidimicrobiales bacterium]